MFSVDNSSPSTKLLHQRNLYWQLSVPAGCVDGVPKKAVPGWSSAVKVLVMTQADACANGDDCPNTGMTALMVMSALIPGHLAAHHPWDHRTSVDPNPEGSYSDIERTYRSAHSGKRYMPAFITADLSCNFSVGLWGTTKMLEPASRSRAIVAISAACLFPGWRSLYTGIMSVYCTFGCNISL